MTGSYQLPLDPPLALGTSARRSAPAAAEDGSPVLLRLDRVSIERGGKPILDGIDLEIRRGSITAIVGPSGIGKSSLLATLNGLLRPASGTLSVDGIGPLRTPASLLAHRRGSATVFQEHALIARLSALDNVLLGLADRRHPLSPLPWPRAMREEALAALAEVGLLGKALDPVARLSGGERQRVGIARALVRKPRLLLADEPFASVDPALAERLAAEFLRLVREHALTLVIVLHQLDLARRLAERIVGLGDGRVVFDGSPERFDAAAQERLFPLHSAPESTPP
ncbi:MULTISPECIES: phosphonate ABC transporter ATP-binding protein [Azotobacter]|uniref:phosphonate ABC transporter ATP-binding protein n=1 Tax=Azotobacter TaxID=352 RepID=UPI000045A69B|nr:ATP-binding cassette domain-containing protein [Azotobacter vinelandii]WKN22290.1 ATP-binding cassette domain-containing protein [Azotobacter vinelandii]GLK58702.1 phosphonates import ATP-binding protein PhnC [Azotobacter vinelandii]SFX09857.1 phosphonate transport system ATP-binding protein [Azotobacter vinelandii]